MINPISVPVTLKMFVLLCQTNGANMAPFASAVALCLSVCKLGKGLCLGCFNLFAL